MFPYNHFKHDLTLTLYDIKVLNSLDMILNGLTQELFTSFYNPCNYLYYASQFDCL